MAADKMRDNPAKYPDYYVNRQRMKDCVKDSNLLQARVIGTNAYKVINTLSRKRD